MYRSLCSIIAFLLVPLIFGCASVELHPIQRIGAKHPIAVTTPDNSFVEIEIERNGEVIQTYAPKYIIVFDSRVPPINIRVIDTCYDEFETTVRGRIAPLFWWNIFFPPGFLIDWANGAMRNYSPRLVVLELNKRLECLDVEEWGI